MLAGDSVVENAPPEVNTALYDVVVNSGSAPRVLDLKNVFVDTDLNDEVSIFIHDNSNPSIVVPFLQGEELLLEFTGTLGNSVITLRGADSEGQTVLSAFHVNVVDGASSISATISDVSSIKSVGTVQAQLSPPDVLNAWEPAALEVWYTIGNDTPSGPFDFGVRFQALASYFEPPTAHATLGSQMNLQHYEIDEWNSTFAYIQDLDLSTYQLGDKVLIASFVYTPTSAPSGSPASSLGGSFPSLSHENLFQVQECVFIGTKLGVYEPHVASQIAPVVFDANNDGRVGLADFAQFISSYGKSSNPFSTNHVAAATWFDFNRDGRVGISDFAMFIGSYGKQRGIHADFDIPGLTMPLNQFENIVAPPSVGVPIFSAVDQVFDDTNQVLYVMTSFGHLERWSYDGQILLSRFEDIATTPSGFDITPDGQYAYVGDAFVENSQGTVWKVDLSDGSKTALVWDLAFGEEGVYDLAIASNGKAFFTTDYAGSGWTPLHEIDLATGAITNLASVRQNTGIARGADRSLLFFQESNISSGPIFTYDANQGTFSTKTNTNRFLGTAPIAIGPKGDSLVFLNTLLNNDLEGDIVGQGIGYAPTFDHARRFVYSIDTATDEVLVHDAHDLKLLRRIPIGAGVTNDVKVAISGDSQHLFVSTPSGIRQVATTLLGTNPDDLQGPSGEVIRFFHSNPVFVPPWLTIRFDEPVTGLTMDDLQLTRDGGSNLLNGFQSLFTIDGGRTWILFGARTLMAQAGTYTLHVEAVDSGIQDLNGNLLTSDIYQVWTYLLSETDDVHVPFAGIRDQVFDETHGILYVTTENGSLQRWDVATQSLLASIDHIAVLPSGLDVTPDGRYAYVGEGANAVSQGVVWKVDLITGIKTPIRYTYDGGERGVFDLAIAADGKAFFTTNYAGSAWNPLRSIDLATGQVTSYRDVRQSTGITRGADRSLLFFQESNSSAGPMFTYDAVTHTLSSSQNTGRFIGSLPDAVSRDGSQIAFLGSIMDSSDFSTTAIGISNAAAYAFDPLRDLLYVADYVADEVVAYDPTTLGEIGRFPIGEDISGTVRMAINQDASLVFITTVNGLRQVPLAVPPGDVVPPVAEFFAVVPQERFDAISTASIQFNEQVTGVTLDDFQLTLSGGANLLTGSETVTTNDGGLTWVIDGLQLLTDSLGDYQLQLIASGSGIQDLAGNLLVWDTDVNWKVISPAIGGMLLPIVNARDHIFDPSTGILFVTTPDGMLQRWDVDSGTQLESFDNISTNPRGLDVTADGQFAYIGEGTPGPTGGIVWKVDLSDGSKTALVYDLDFGEQGVYDLAIASNGKAYFTTDYGGSGWTPLHELDLATGEIISLPDVRENTGITRSADRSLLFFQESNISSGPIFTFDADAGTFSSKTNTNGFIGSLPAAIDRNNNQIAFLGKLYDATDLTSTTSTGLASVAGYIFDPTQDVLYVANNQSDTIIAFDPITLTTIDTFPIGENISGTVDISASDDGSIVFVTSPMGIRAVPISLPVMAASESFVLEGEAPGMGLVILPVPEVSMTGSPSEAQVVIQNEPSQEDSPGFTETNWDDAWQREFEQIDADSFALSQEEAYTCSVDDLFDQLDESELELLTD
ncbi:hypothetical protein [Bremerella sp.]|uniref:hypothetical protein n=1 Tax=Bremerella sp. TaxID=2795602 RepID=UPI003919E672